MEQLQSDRLARLEQRADDIERRLGDLGTMSTQMATVLANIGHMDRDLAMVRDEVERISESLSKRDEEVSRERKQTRVALYTMVGVLGASFLSGVAAVIAGMIGG